MQTITPYLTVKGAAAALEFYRTAFGASDVFQHPADDGKRILHARMTIKGGTVMLSDEFPEHSGTPAPTPEKPTRSRWPSSSVRRPRWTRCSGRPSRQVQMAG
jgi:uncharacterized glyoxalase superfamily protein PhnB